MSRTLVAFGKVPQREPQRGTTPGNAIVILRDLVRACVPQTHLANEERLRGTVRRAFLAMTGEYPEPEQVRAILSPET